MRCNWIVLLVVVCLALGGGMYLRGVLDWQETRINELAEPQIDVARLEFVTAIRAAGGNDSISNEERSKHVDVYLAACNRARHEAEQLLAQGQA